LYAIFFLKSKLDFNFRENNQKHLPWKKIAEKFNKALDLPNYKKPSQCSERWKNVLSKKCKKYLVLKNI